MKTYTEYQFIQTIKLHLRAIDPSASLLYSLSTSENRISMYKESPKMFDIYVSDRTYTYVDVLRVLRWVTQQYIQ